MFFFQFLSLLGLFFCCMNSKTYLQCVWDTGSMNLIKNHLKNVRSVAMKTAENNAENHITGPVPILNPASDTL